MNDPGADVPIAEAAGDVDEGRGSNETEAKLLQSTVWWFASTASPLLAGTFGPMASAFNVCSIAQYWRVWIPPGKPEIQGLPLEDPSWLLAVNIVSLLIAIAANFALLLNMARRISLPVGQSVSISGWFAASAILIVLIGVANSDEFSLEPAESHALSQAYYYAIMSAVLYMFAGLIMTLTVFGAYAGHYPKAFNLTTSQRTLMLQTISFMIYLIGGAAVYSRIENWKLPDAVFWADYTLLTIGIGVPFTPTSHLGRGLLFPYAFGGLVIVGLIIGSIRSLVLDRGKEKMEARMLEKEREKVLSAIESGQPSVNLGYFKKLWISHDEVSAVEKRYQEFVAMRAMLDFAEQKRRWTALFFSTLASAALWFIGALIFMLAHPHDDRWTYFVSLYFSFTSLLTIGYGDFEPKTNSSRPFFVFWSLLAVPTLTIWIGDLSDTVVRSFKNLTIWIGSVTILPDDQDPRSSIQGALRRAVSDTRRVLNIDNERLIGASTDHLHEDRVISARFEEHARGQGCEATRYRNKPKDFLADDHFLCLVIVEELKVIQASFRSSPSKRFSYPDWVFYLRLIGQDEFNTEQHRNLEDIPSNRMPHLGEGGGAQRDRLWSWLGNRSPLMSRLSEAEWISHALRDRLGELLRRQKPDRIPSEPTSVEKESEEDGLSKNASLEPRCP